MKGQGGGGTAKGGGKNRKGGGSVVVTKEEAMKTAALDSTVVLLRKALRDDQGNDKNVANSIAKSFFNYARNGLDCAIEFYCSLDLGKLDEGDEMIDTMFDITKDQMESIYDSSGYGWDDDDKITELSDGSSRFLIVKDRKKNDQIVGFVNFRFTVLGECFDRMDGDACLHTYDIQVSPDYARKGIGRHLMTILELIARKEKMRFLSFPIYLGNTSAQNFVTKLNKMSKLPFVPDTYLSQFGFSKEKEGFELYVKELVHNSQKDINNSMKDLTISKNKGDGNPMPSSPTTSFVKVGHPVELEEDELEDGWTMISK